MKRAAIIAVVALAVATVLIISGCGSATPSAPSSSPAASDAPAVTPTAPTASKRTLRYVKRTMPKLAKVRRLWSGGSYDDAIKLWKSIGSIPVATSVDKKLSKAYLSYANDLRYWMMEDGSCTTKQLESSQEKAMAAWREYR